MNYRANLWALRAVGVRQVVAPCAVGSLRPELGPGTVVVPDQVIDRTWGREHTVYDGADDRAGHVVHVAFADPFCPLGRAAVLGAATSGGGRPSTERPWWSSTALASRAGPSRGGTRRRGGRSSA